MRRHVVAALSVLAVVAGVGWKLANHPETSARLSDITLSQRSEQSHAGPTAALSRIRIRISADSASASRATAGQVPHIALAAE
jgi:hypothetical protein